MIEIDGGEFPKDIVFAQIGKEMIEKINGKYIKEKYNIYNNEKVGELIREERIRWLKNKYSKTY